jgi:phenylacetate-CoA ligase
MSLQCNNLKKLISHAYKYSKYYKKLFDDNNFKPSDIKSKADLEKIPILTKELLNKNTNFILSDNFKNRKMIKVTSGGSTGNQSLIYKSRYYQSMSQAIYLNHMCMTGWEPLDKCVWIWGAPYEHAKLSNSIIAKIGVKLNNRLLLNAYNYGPNDFKNWADKINRFLPKIIYGYSSILSEFSSFMISHNIVFPSVKIVVSTTEKLEKRKQIEDAFNCKVYNQYGCREIPMIAVECPNDHMHIADDHVIVESIDGEILLTSLHSFGFPLIRYKVGDTGLLVDDIEECKNKFSHLDLKIGRITDNFIKNDGSKVSSSALATFISTFELKIDEYQIIQRNISTFVVNYVSKNTLTESDENIIKKILTEYFGDIDVTISNVEKILPEVSGKKLLFKCLVTN